MNSANQRLNNLKQSIEQATELAGRAAHSVTLLAVSKAQKINHIAELHAAGQTLFGENYLSEALPKIAALKDLNLEWHFIGPIQSNKTRDIASHFDWVQSLDRLKIAKRLNDQRPSSLPPLQVTLQVNLFSEETKSGTTEQALFELAKAVDAMPNLKLRGLMSIPPAQTECAKQKQQFEAIYTVFKQLQATYPDIDTLSMGMSGDMNQAIASGSTMVRVGTALFGERPADWKKHINE